MSDAYDEKTEADGEKEHEAVEREEAKDSFDAEGIEDKDKEETNGFGSRTEEEQEETKILDDAEEDPLGGLDIETTADISVPDSLIDQVIGQEHAVDIVRKAAKQKRHVMMIGSPGTGKSMLAKAMAEMLPREQLEDTLVYHNPDDGNKPKVRTVPAGKGKEIVESYKEEARKRDQMRTVLMWIIIIGIVVYSFFVRRFLLGIIAAGVIFIAFRYLQSDSDANVPNLLVDNSDKETAPFRDATGAHAGALLGDVRHDPFQSGGLGTPSHDRVEAGAIHEAHHGVLFIDEINTLDIRNQQSLMTAIQEGRYSITGQSERSSGAMVQTEDVPCDFVMVAAGNMDAMENMHPALRSRIKGYGYEVNMKDTIDDTPEVRRKYARFVAQEVDKDGNIPHFERDAVAAVIKEAQRRAGRKDHLTLKLRDLGGLVRVAGDIADDEGADLATKEHVLQAKNRARSIEQQLTDRHIERKQDYDMTVNEGGMVGRVNGLAVMGEDSGRVLPIMAEVTEGKGEVIATGKLQEIAEESVDNVSAIIKKFTGKDVNEMDVHIQYVQTYEGVEGDSASITMATAIISALEDVAVDQSVAMTGSLSVRGDVLPVGGVTYKIEAAAKAGMKKVIIPAVNEQDVMIEDEYKDEIEIIPVRHISEVLDHALVERDGKKGVLDKIKNLASEFDVDAPAGQGQPSPQ
ncbi:MAG: ATP-dependent protease LonB [Halobacteriales archaeon]|nr:ATP-dependent protease LonB [Halobacteriales archaeon]